MNDHGWLARATPSPALRVIAGICLLGLVGTSVGTARTTVVEPYRIPSDSMQPTLLVGDHVLVAKYRYVFQLPLLGPLIRWDTPSAEDVVVIRYPRDRLLNYVLRVVAVAGDRVEVRGHRPIVNGVPVAWAPIEGLPEPMDAACRVSGAVRFVETVERPSGPPAHHVLVDAGRGLADYAEHVVPEGTVFVLGDHRSSADDSRRWGFVPVDDVLGQVQQTWFSLDACTQQVRSERTFRSVNEVPGE